MSGMLIVGSSQRGTKAQQQIRHRINARSSASRDIFHRLRSRCPTSNVLSVWEERMLRVIESSRWTNLALRERGEVLSLLQVVTGGCFHSPERLSSIHIKLSRKMWEIG